MKTGFYVVENFPELPFGVFLSSFATTSAFLTMATFFFVSRSTSRGSNFMSTLLQAEISLNRPTQKFRSTRREGSIVFHFAKACSVLFLDQIKTILL